MTKLNPLAQRRKIDRMLPDLIADPQRMHPNLPRLPLRIIPMTAIRQRLPSFPRRLKDRISDGKRRPARRIFFESMMPFDDFNVVLFAQRFGRLRRQFQQNIHTDAHIRRLQDGNIRRGNINRRMILIFQRGRPNDHPNLPVPASLQPMPHPRRQSKINQHIRLRPKIKRNRNPNRPDPRKLPRILRKLSTLRPINRRDQLKSLIRMRQRNKPPPHPPARPGNRKFNSTHFRFLVSDLIRHSDFGFDSGF